VAVSSTERGVCLQILKYKLYRSSAEFPFISLQKYVPKGSGSPLCGGQVSDLSYMYDGMLTRCVTALIPSR
jgi:hypothetical protein